MDPNPKDWTGITDTNIEEYRSFFKSIRGISAQTVDDLVDVVTKFRNNSMILVFTETIVSIKRKHFIKISAS